MEIGDRTCSTSEAAAQIGVSVGTLHNFIRSGKCARKPPLILRRRRTFYLWTQDLIEEYRSTIGKPADGRNTCQDRNG